MSSRLQRIAFAICSLAGVLGVSRVDAQQSFPFQVLSGLGRIDNFPSPANPIENHEASGMAVFGGETLNYTGTGQVRALGLPDPNTGFAPFESSLPYVFDFGNGDTLPMHYGRTDFGAPQSGMVLVEDAGNGLIDTTWFATFNPVPGGGTGRFENVIDGAIFMTAHTDPFDPTQPDVIYEWSSDVGFLTIIPEPASVVLMTVVALTGLCSSRPRRSEVS